MSELLAPNGKPSNLTPEQYKLVRTPAFKKWFGDWEKDPANASKVVDENGEPLICYHGTFREFNVFEWSKDGGFYFTEFSRIAEIYARSVQEGKLTKTPNENPIVLKCFLNFKNPLRERVYGIVGKNKRLINIAIKKDYDSLIISGGQDVGGYYDQYVAFEPNQIKLADGSNTTFDGNNTDIRFDEGGGVDYSDFKTSVIGLVKDNKVLILKRGSTANWMPNKWSLVGGVVDSGEEPKEAIIRECFEEIGLKPINVSFNHKIMTNDSGEIYYFNGELESENVKLDYENSTFKFIAKDEINNYDFVPYIKEFIIDIFSKKINNNNITFNSGGELNKGLFSQIWEWFGIKF